MAGTTTKKPAEPQIGGDDETGERWLPVSGYEVAYEVSDRGAIRSIDRRDRRGRRWPGKLLAPTLRDDGYYDVRLSLDGVVRTRKVHQLVAEAFIGPRPDGEEVRHRNGDSTDNRASNLHYGTRSDNLRDAVEHGTHAMAKRTECPRGHALIEPNLVRSALENGHRQCKACARERAGTQRGRQFDAARADKRFKAIIEGVAA